jgi:hypothetical protein
VWVTGGRGWGGGRVYENLTRRESDKAPIVWQLRRVSPSSLHEYRNGQMWSDLHFAVMDNRSIFVSTRKRCQGGKGEQQCPVLRERFLAIEKMIDGIFRTLLPFLYSDEYTSLEAKVWDQFLQDKSLRWNAKGRKILNESKSFVRTMFGWKLLDPPKVEHPPSPAPNSHPPLPIGCDLFQTEFSEEIKRSGQGQGQGKEHWRRGCRWGRGQRWQQGEQGEGRGGRWGRWRRGRWGRGRRGHGRRR